LKRRFFVLLGEGMPKISLDGVEVADLPPGSFNIGVGATKTRPPHAFVNVVFGPRP
jgi:hypothetical protein